MSLQRRRGQAITLWPVTEAVDRRGNRVRAADEANAITTKGWVIPQRSARAEVVGQQQINVIRIGIAADLAGIELWSNVVYGGKDWDVVTPPAYHHGTRHTRHWSIDLRERP